MRHAVVNALPSSTRFYASKKNWESTPSTPAKTSGMRLICKWLASPRQSHEQNWWLNMADVLRRVAGAECKMARQNPCCMKTSLTPRYASISFSSVPSHKLRAKYKILRWMQRVKINVWWISYTIWANLMQCIFNPYSGHNSFYKFMVVTRIASSTRLVLLIPFISSYRISSALNSSQIPCFAANFPNGLSSCCHSVLHSNASRSRSSDFSSQTKPVQILAL